MTEIGVVEDVYEVEVALKEPETAKPSRVEPVLLKDSVNEVPEIIVMECEFPSAGNVAGEGEPPVIVTVAGGAELLRVTVIS